MRNQIFKCSLVIALLIAISIQSYSQCKDKLGYDANGSLGSVKNIKGYLSVKDTAIRMFLNATIVKTELTNGINLWGMFEKVGFIDNTTKVKITFDDKTSIILTDHLSSTNSSNPGKGNDFGFFGAVITDKYKLLLLKTKPIIKVQITGELLDAMTYQVDSDIALQFLLGMDCLQEYL